MTFIASNCTTVPQNLASILQPTYTSSLATLFFYLCGKFGKVQILKQIPKDPVGEIH